MWFSHCFTIHTLIGLPSRSFLADVLAGDMATYPRTESNMLIDKAIVRDDEVPEWQRVCDKHAKGPRSTTSKYISKMA